MTRLSGIVVLAVVLCALPGALQAQPQNEAAWEIRPLHGEGEVMMDLQTGLVVITNGVIVRYGEAVLTAERVTVDQPSGEVVADGQVRLQQGEQIWVSEHLSYNFKTHQIQAAQFRTGQTPVFAAGQGLHADLSNQVHTATNVVLTTDDVSKPAIQVRAKYIKIIPNKCMVARDATVYYGGVPVFYFPYYRRNLGQNANNFNFTPGYRTLYGPFLLGNYTWYWSDMLNGVTRLDYRQKRGPGAGQDLNYNLGPWGHGSFSYYYTHDKDPNADGLDAPIPENRQRLYISYQANPATNLFVTGLLRYESDVAMDRDFFERAYIEDPQPNSFLEVNKFWDNFSLDTYVQPQVNEFLETVERLPDVRLTGYRQELGETPLYYESESSAGYYRRQFAEDTGILGPPPGLNYEAARVDTYHQVLLPKTFFGWLNVTPRVGGRLTYYSTATGPGATTDDQVRGVFNTGAEVSFKASQVWPGVQNDLFDVDGLRHIIEPSADYVFVPAPSVPPAQLPQFDYQLPSLWLLPIDFPDYNDIDSIDSQNVIRWGLRNKLQTKREGKVTDLLYWDLDMDWRLDPRPGQTSLADIYSDLSLRPRDWLMLESLTRVDPTEGFLRMSFTTLTLRPNSIWSWSLGHYYLRDDLTPSPTALGEGNNVFTSTFFFRLNENWGFSMSHYFDAHNGRLQQQAYTVYRDLRSWTAGLTFLARDNTIGPQDYTVAFTFSLKAYPHFGLGADAGGPLSLLGH